jgi:DNA-binding response OmpR family regulator
MSGSKRRFASPRILIVDDEPESVALLVAFLRDRYPDVMVARDGFDGLEKAARGLPDVILLDMSMPGLSGVDVCLRLKADARLAWIPVIFLTAHSAVEEKLLAFDAGAVDYITKPFSDREVLARIAVHAASTAINNNAASMSVRSTGPARVNDLETRDDHMLQMACEYLRENLSSAPTLAELSTVVRTAAPHLDRLFHRRLGVSVFEYSLELRLCAARQLLLETDHKIQQVAWEVGYANPGDLSRAFQRRFGVTPRGFRVSRKHVRC